MHTRLKNVASFEESQISDILETNLTEFFNWGFLQVGGFFNVSFPSTGTQLRRVSEVGYTDGCVFEGYRQGWIWESGIASPFSPVQISGVWVNDVFRPLGSGYHIDYPQGRVVFTTPLPTGAVVECEFSFRRVQLATADNEWFREIQFDSYDWTDQDFLSIASGAWNVLARNRVQLPAIVVEPINRVRLRPKELGSHARVHSQDVLLHVLAETPFDRGQLHDMLIEQWDHDIVLFDVNRLTEEDRWPLLPEGYPRPSAYLYDTLVAPTGEGGYFWRKASFTDVSSEPQTSYPPLYRASVRLTVEVDLP